MKAGGGGGRKFIFQQGSRALLEKRRRKKRRVETFGAIGISRDPVLRMLVAVSSRWRSKIFDSGIRFVSIHWTGRPIPMTCLRKPHLSNQIVKAFAVYKVGRVIFLTGSMLSSLFCF